MRHIRYIFSALILLFTSTLFPLAASAADGSWKKVSIDGLRVFSEQELVKKCALDTFPAGTSAFRDASRRINNFYYRRGYYLALTYRVEETADTLSLFVDEGRLGQVIIRGLDDITLLRFKYDFDIEGKTYNGPALAKELARLTKRYGFKEIKATLVEAKDYSRQFIQLDGSFQLPFFGSKRLPLFEQYGYRYNLTVEPVFYSKGEAEKKIRGLQYGIRLGYPGITPNARYTIPSLFVRDDRLQIDCSTGIAVSPTSPLKKPSMSFIQSGSTYSLVPMFDSLFTPRIRGNGYYSSASRSDIGLISYDYLKSSAALEPGITLLSHFRIFAGAGIERVFFFSEKTEPMYTDRYSGLKGDHWWKTLSAHAELGQYIGLIMPELWKSVNFDYTWFFDGTTFKRFELAAHSDYSVRKYDILTTSCKGVWLRGTVPFYYEHAVNDDDFIGFAGRDYYTRTALKLKLEYITSIYRDFLFIGPYLHNVAFKGTGRTIGSRQYGTAAGITGRWVFWDQFEARVYAGKDCLWTKRMFGTDIMFSVSKKF